jgi:predicted amidohydrolase YtcJ
MAKSHPVRAFVNANVYLGDGERAEAFATAASRFIYVGSDEEARSLYARRGGELIDLQGAFVLPGIIDAHAHVAYGGAHVRNLNLSGADSREAFIAAVRKYAAERSGWIKGSGWTEARWGGAPAPDKSWLDEAAPDRPALLYRMDFHTAVANSKALELARVTDETLDPDGGSIDRDASGEPTGILRDKAIEMVEWAIPEPTEEETMADVRAGLAEAARNGVTAIHDISTPAHFGAHQLLSERGELTARIYARYYLEHARALADAGIRGVFGDEYLKIGGVKAFADGSLGGGSAWLFDAYEDDPTNMGIPADVVVNGLLERSAVKYDRRGLQFSVHAIGDRANAWTLDLLEKLEHVNLRENRRFRIEHAQHLRPKDIKRIAALGAVASCQPYHLAEDGLFAEKKIGANRLRSILPLRSLIDAGARVAFGSDFPVVTMNPFKGMKAATTRQTLDGRYPDGLAPEEKITIDEAIAGYTIGAAYAAFDERRIGSITEGKLADYVVLDRDPFAIEPNDLDKIQVLKTVVGERVVYEA